MIDKYPAKYTEETRGRDRNRPHFQLAITQKKDSLTTTYQYDTINHLFLYYD